MPAWMDDETELPTSAIAKVTNTSIVLELDIEDLVADEIRWDAISYCYFQKSRNISARVNVDETLMLGIKKLYMQYDTVFSHWQKMILSGYQR